jgi:hypothetical protein
VTPKTLQDSPTPPPHTKTDPSVPRIPGVAQKPPRAPLQLKSLLTVILAALLCASGFALWLSYRRHAAANSSATAEIAAASASSARKGDTEPNAVATLYELAAPWSSKTFSFVDPNTRQSVPAMIIHLPGPPAEPSFWAFALTSPFSRCQLQYLADLGALAHRFGVSAAHPMVVSDCDGAVFDPLKMATLPDGSWVRGDIVHGGAIRPPISIQIEVRGRDIVADRIE